MSRALLCAVAVCLLGSAAAAGIPGMRFTALLLLAAAAALGLWSLLHRWAAKGSRLGRTAQRIFVGLLAAGTLLFAAMEICVLSGSRSDTDTEVCCIIVLGAGVNGTVPSLTLSTRLQAALAYSESRPELPILVTGGQGLGESITEAEASFRWLTNRGVDPERIWLEESSVNTAENLQNAAAILRAQGLYGAGPVAVVSSDFHLFRARLLAGRQGLDAVGVGAELPYPWLTANYYTREAFALAKTLLFD